MAAPKGMLPAHEVKRRKSFVTTHGAFLGVPRNDHAIVNGQHPFSPNRIIALPKDQVHGFVDAGLLPLCGQVREQVDDQLKPLKCNSCPDEKLALLVRIAAIFASHYKRPDALLTWSRGLVWRETFASTGVGRGCGIPHQFQRPPADCVETDSGFVDWWVFLIPSGTDFDGFDEMPVHFLAVHLFESWNTDIRGQLNVWSLATRLMREPPPFFPTWHEFAQTEPIEAARLLNDRLFCLLEEFDPC